MKRSFSRGTKLKIELMKLNKYIIAFVFICISKFSFSQIKQFDKMEMLYDQGHYRMVLVRAQKLLDNPEYDYSMIPTYYKSLALFQLSQRKGFSNRNPNALDDAKELFSSIKNSKDGIKIINAHIHEITALKRDLYAWAEDLKIQGKRQQYDQLKDILDGLFDSIPDIENEGELKSKDLIAFKAENDEDKTENLTIRKFRESIVETGKKQIGTPYLSAGTDPNRGFDCSGFTSYVFMQHNKSIPRRAIDQFEGSKKLKQKSVKPGDLIFFDSGAGINHVGMIVSKKGEPLIMIHASSSKGIVITEIEKSSYWNKRIAGFGTYIE
jgi:cell wall-associated NlpC family hydrolase